MENKNNKPVDSYDAKQAKIATRMTEVLASHRSLLRSLVGESIQSARVVWYDPCDVLHAASPVILRISSRNLELWSIYLTEFGFSWDSIDLCRPPFCWIGQPDPESRWVEAPQPALRRACGEVIRTVRLLSFGDLCAGIEFGFDRWALSVVTEADDLLITDEPLSRECRWVDL